MTEEIKNDIDKLDGMVKMKKCGYEFIGGCSELRRLKQENETIKKQYNCYACGGCNGKEDYINLEKHHLGLRKQFDRYYQAIQKIKKLSTVNVSIENFVKIQKVILEAEKQENAQ